MLVTGGPELGVVSMRVCFRGWAGGRAARGAGAVVAGALAVLTLLATGAPPALALPGVRPTTERGNVPEMGLTMVDGSALHCPAGVTKWSPLVVPIEMAIPQGEPNGSIDPRETRNMPDGSSLWYRSLGDLRTGGPMKLDTQWTQDGRTSIPITRTQLRSGTYLLGALCAKPGGGRHTFPLDANGALIGEWYVVTFTWVDSRPETGTFHFERQHNGSGIDTATAPATAPTAPAPQAAAAHAHDDASGDSDGTGWFLIAAAGLLVVVALGVTGVRLRRRATGPGTGEPPSSAPGTSRVSRSPEDK
ncbi:hypothetical protein [Actinomadura terrae]|uniref:hypothetical protein n=1 Tax=Actinomadura terrae TaxID=604353 RepID=UPI001FA7F28B|nr:hypothetical protein [Actinomadura terrae]